jgi:NAD(P)-dependent dehydrogenase (short-subunit alcohol dehydrogenase family)
MNPLQNSEVAAASLAGRRILVVGAGRASGPRQPAANGNAACLALARAGARVACADRDPDAAQRTVDDIAEAGGQALALQADAADVAQIEGMVEQAVAGLGGLDGLVLNVGVSHRTPLAGLTPENWDAVMNVNTRAHVFCAKYALPRMARGGSIVFVSSTASRRPGGRNPAYETSKAALSAVCRAVALEGQPAGIRANIVMLGGRGPPRKWRPRSGSCCPTKPATSMPLNCRWMAACPRALSCAGRGGARRARI